MKKHQILFCVFILFSCNKEEINNSSTDAILDLPVVPFDYSTLSANAPHAKNDNTPIDNPITNHGATLGRVLFYDTKLSSNDKISCASCHKQEFSFTDNAIKSIGVNGNTLKNSMHLVNVRHFASGKMFWNFRANTLEEQVLMPIQDKIEMNMPLPDLVSKLNNTGYYKPLFQKAFGSTTINSDKISKALAQFIRSINSYDVIKPPQTMAQQQGFMKFNETTNEPTNPLVASCAECHSGTQVLEFTAQGLPNPNVQLFTNGRGFGDEPKFMKVANMINIAFTAPYGHDGRYASLETLVENHGNNLNATDVTNIVAFLKTLKDTTLMTSKKYSDPFKK